MSMPKPPGINRTVTEEAPDAKWGATPEEKVVDTRLTDNETEFILQTTLSVAQRNDPLILKFIKSYLDCRHVRQASKECGIRTDQGKLLLRKPEVHACIEAITQKALMKYGYDASEIIERVKEVAAIDLIEFENPDGSFKTHLSQITPESRRAIKKLVVKNTWDTDPNGMKVITGQIVTIEVWDKLKAAELLGRDKGVFKETKKVEHDVTENMATLLLGSKERADRRTTGPREVTPVVEITGRVDDEGET